MLRPPSRLSFEYEEDFEEAMLAYENAMDDYEEQYLEKRFEERYS